MSRKHPTLVFAALALSLFAASVVAGRGTFAGKVVRISDGDTIGVLYGGKEVRVRLWGIDAPESGQPYGRAAKKLASELCFGQTVTVDVRDTDRYGRAVALVRLADGRILNHELVAHGLAWWFRRYAPGNETLERLERGARASRRGLWADDAPVAPWEYRAARAY